MGLEFDRFLTLKFFQSTISNTKKYAEFSTFESKYIKTK